MPHTFEIDGVQLAYGQRPILSDVYMRCDTGVITGLLGRNGCGKSTLMQVAFGTRSAYTSSVRCDGRYVKAPYCEPGFINYLPQFHFVPAGMRVATALRWHKVTAKDFIDAFPDFTSLLNNTMQQLSGGQRRTVEIFLILKAPAKFSILDEPFSHVMPLHIQTIQQLMQEQKHHKGIIITDHLYKHILDTSDSLHLLKDGKTHLVKDKQQLVQLGYISQLPY